MASLKHPHIVAFHESFFDTAEQVLFIIQVNLPPFIFLIN